MLIRLFKFEDLNQNQSLCLSQTGTYSIAASIDASVDISSSLCVAKEVGEECTTAIVRSLNYILVILIVNKSYSRY